MKRFIFVTLALILSTLALGACYGNTNIDEEGKFICNDNNDCLPEFECKETPPSSGKKFCMEKSISRPGVGNCKDFDSDGYGMPGLNDEDYAACDACKKAGADPVQCRLPDCDDNDGTVYPGALEICDGKNNACKKVYTDADDGIVSCQKNSDCADLNLKIRYGSTVTDKGISLNYKCKNKVCVLDKGDNATYSCKSGKIECEPNSSTC